jgi:V/A-type H+/Na+-transporting ATPase subunit E
MKAVETGRDKVKKICEVLRRETLEPAEHEAGALLEKARIEAAVIIREAERRAEEIEKKAQEEANMLRTRTHSSLQHACKQTLETLRQTIIDKLLHPELAKWLGSGLKDSKVLASVIEAVVKGIEKEGIACDLQVYIAADVPARDVNALLAPQVIKRLREKGVLVGTFAGGIQVKLVGENLTIDLSDLTELLCSYVSKDFREMFFGVNAG